MISTALFLAPLSQRHPFTIIDPDVSMSIGAKNCLPSASVSDPFESSVLLHLNWMYPATEHPER